MLIDYQVDQDKIRLFATTVGGATFFSLSAYSSDWFFELGTFGQFLTIAISVLSLNGFVAVLNWLMVRFWWARHFYGEWFYISDSIQHSPEGHVGRVRFFVRNFSLSYRVQIFAFADVDQLLTGNYEPELLGTAKSKGIAFDGDDGIEILYELVPTSGPGGPGILYLSNASSGTSMTGRWVTAREDQAPKSGKSRWFRRSQFRTFVDELKSHQSNEDSAV